MNPARPLSRQSLAPSLAPSALSLERPRVLTTTLSELAPDLALIRNVMVNLYCIGPAGAPDRGWTLVDAGLPASAQRIAALAAQRFGADSRPQAIVLTHGHFDHVGSLLELATRWDVPVYAHPLELPYLTGRSSYPPPEPAVGGGLMALSSPLYPRGPIDLGSRVMALPEDGRVPGLPDWRWIATPGHSPGHVSLWRAGDHTLIVGDAFVTTRQESAFSALTAQPQHAHGPPAYFTPDWDAARRSVQQLAALEPQLAATGHGWPMRGPALQSQLEELATGFDLLARPTGGRYALEPAITDASGVVRVPPARHSVPLLVLLSVALWGLFLALRR